MPPRRYVVAMLGVAVLFLALSGGRFAFILSDHPLPGAVMFALAVSVAGPLARGALPPPLLSPLRGSLLVEQRGNGPRVERVRQVAVRGLREDDPDHAAVRGDDRRARITRHHGRGQLERGTD